jgi:AsmA protein
VLKQGDVHIGKALAHLTGDYNTTGQAIAVRLKLAGQGMPAPDLQATLPAIGMMLPSGASLKQGKLDVNLTISGPVDRLLISGPITLADATVAGFDLGGRLGALPSFSGAPASPAGTGNTLIQTLAATLRVAPDGIRIDNLNLVAPALGALTGSGTIAPNGSLDFRMLAKLMGAAAGQLSRVTSLGQSAGGIPFRVQGTSANPVFVPDVGRVVSDLAKDPETAKKAISALGGLFGGKKR